MQCGAIKFTCIDGSNVTGRLQGLLTQRSVKDMQVVGRMAVGAGSLTGSVWRGAGVRTIHVVHYMYL